MKLEPIHILALHVFGWSLLAAASFFFHVVAFVVVILAFAYKVQEFKFVYENTKDVENGYDPTEYEQLTIPGIDPGTELGTERERSIP
jgi:hypothetical protein